MWFRSLSCSTKCATFSHVGRAGPACQPPALARHNSDGLHAARCSSTISPSLRLPEHWRAMSPSTESDYSLEHLVFEIAKGVSGETGAAYFRSLARHLAIALDADYVLVGALQPDGERITTLAFHGPAGEEAALEYKLAGTP